MNSVNIRSCLLDTLSMSESSCEETGPEEQLEFRHMQLNWNSSLHAPRIFSNKIHAQEQASILNESSSSITEKVKGFKITKKQSRPTSKSSAFEIQNHLVQNYVQKEPKINKQIEVVIKTQEKEVKKAVNRSLYQGNGYTPRMDNNYILKKNGLMAKIIDGNRPRPNVAYAPDPEDLAMLRVSGHNFSFSYQNLQPSPRNVPATPRRGGLYRA